MNALDGGTEACIVGDGGIAGSHGTSFALIRLDLGKGDARGIFDTGMAELLNVSCPPVEIGRRNGETPSSLTESES
jgi:hypothetical protein